MVNGKTTVWCQSSYLQGSPGLLTGSAPLLIYFQKKNQNVWKVGLQPAPFKGEKG